MTTARAARTPNFAQTGVTFNRVDHRYAFHGEPVLNVTRVLRDHKISADWTRIPVDVETLARKCSLGLAVHAAAHYYDEGDLRAGTVAPEVEPYLEGWERCVRELDAEMILLETPLVHPVRRVAGTLDRLWILHALGGAIGIGDIKTGDPDDAGAGPQTAAYEQNVRGVLSPGLLDRPDLAAKWGEPWTRHSVQLLPTGKYRLFPYRSHKDLILFNAALTCEAGAHSSWRQP